jgi:hypothetical protein
MPISRLNSFTTQNAPANGGRGSGLAKDLPIGATLADVRQAQRSQGQLSNSPPKATAAPTGNTGYAFTGLAEALNTYQNQLVKDTKAQIADIYEFDFNPATLAQSRVKKPGTTDRSKTAGKQATTASQALNNKTDRVNNNSQNWSIQAGTQIIQLIDQIMRSSDYISDQATTQVDPVTQKPIASPGTGTGITTWYKVSVQATSLGYDIIRRDHAYRIKYVITPYAITQMASPYFPDSRYRGSHKSYSYWFTGQNTQIINFEQSYNGLYRLVLSGLGPISQSTRQYTDVREVYSKTAMPTTSEKTGQQTGTYTNSGPDSAADYLYSPSDLATARLRIVGDPAWLQQGEVTNGVDPTQFTFSAFNMDGSINFDSQEVLFDISWNQPQDYDFTTGVMNVNNQNGLSKQNNTYQAIECRSFFSHGKFEQELMGKQFVEFKKAPAPTAAQTRPANTGVVTKPTTTTPTPANKLALAGIVGSSTEGGAFIGYRNPRSAAVRRAALQDPNAYDSTTTINPLDPNNYSN